MWEIAKSDNTVSEHPTIVEPDMASVLKTYPNMWEIEKPSNYGTYSSYTF